LTYSNSTSIGWSTFSEVSPVEKAMIFESHASGRHRNGSDVDIALQGTQLTPAETRQIKKVLKEESTMPFFFDVVKVENVSDPIFLEKISIEGKTIYQNTR